MSSPPDLVVLPDLTALAHEAARRFVALASTAIRTTDRCTVVLSGGSTPDPLYSLLASEAFAGKVDWQKIRCAWGDERCVPPDESASNFGRARDVLLDPAGVPPERVHRIRGEAEPETAAREYEAVLRGVLEVPEGLPTGSNGQRFDLVILGMGADGHTASLFPGSAALEEKQRWAVAVHEQSPPRVTLTFPLINSAREIWFLVAGGEKAKTVRRLLEDSDDRDALPARRIAPREGRLVWFLDAAAAAELPPERLAELSREGGLR